MAKGANARYKIPVFKALAGLSPICCAVLVQIEHWADSVLNADDKSVLKNNIKTNLFIFFNYNKVIQKEFS
jgi:hypothetical protein